MRYINKESSFFCQCDQGYFVADCNTTHNCNCAHDSICFSPSICQLSSNSCQHNEVCIPDDDRISLTTLTCLCSEEYSGEQCQNRSTRIDIQLNEILISNTSLIFIHFIKVFGNIDHELFSSSSRNTYTSRRY
jgi:hypothetical protein